MKINDNIACRDDDGRFLNRGTMIVVVVIVIFSHNPKNPNCKC